MTAGAHEAIVLSIGNLESPVLIGSGGFSSVYSALDTKHDRHVAVKILNEAPNPATLRRFERERRTMGRLSSHPNVVTIFDSGVTPAGIPYIVMELTNSGSLGDLVRDGQGIQWHQALDYLIPVCDALAEAHELGILHRDIKPENILLSRGQAMLTDFGIAQDPSHTSSTSSEIRASWLHAPPETADDRRDHRADIYSVASTLFHLVVGRAPFWRSDDTSLAPLLWRVMNDPPPPFPPGLAPPALEAFVHRCLAKNPDDRPASVTELLTTLRRIRTAGGGGGTGLPPLTAEPTLAVPSRPSPAVQHRNTGFEDVSAESALRLRLPPPRPTASPSEAETIGFPGRNAESPPTQPSAAGSRSSRAGVIVALIIIVCISVLLVGLYVLS